MKAPGGVDQYPSVTIEWIRHHNPELNIINEQGRTTKTIDLSAYNYDGLHKLFSSYFTRRNSGGRLLGDAHNSNSSSSSSSSNSESAGAAAHLSTSLRSNDAALPSTDSFGGHAADDSAAAAWRGVNALRDSFMINLVLGMSLVIAIYFVGRCVQRRRRARKAASLQANNAEAGLCHVA